MITFEFHVSRMSRDKYEIDKSLFSLAGDLIIADFRQARILSEKINSIRKSEGNLEQLVTAGQINALGLLHEIFHYIIRIYEEQVNPGVLSRALNNLAIHLGDKELNEVLLEFVREFPPLQVFRGELSSEEFLSGNTDDKPNKEIILEELILLHLENANPATAMLEELYSDKALIKKSKYLELLDEAEQYFITEKPFGIENLPLFHFLRIPIVSSPYSLDGQIDYILEKWSVHLNEKLIERLLRGKDLILEDLKLFLQGGGKGTPPVPQYKFLKDYFEWLKNKLAAGLKLTEEESAFYHSEIERFTEDIDWMPKVVMIAKNVFVWMDQLSKKYQRSITRLDQIPDEVLDQLASWNFTALWLIGIWERSSASRKIKQLTGNPEAASSAYSLYDYVIASELGGEDAFNNLKDRAWQRGIRLASDMVPNHTGIYSRWVIEKPDYFIQSNYPPYPGYTFNGANLSDDNRVEVRIEDKYYNRTDAAVVFQRRDSFTGDLKYIYHGNDGTHMPWNDTAQLNLLIPEVRESLIQMIMHVARKFPIIRFDAAMTLAKKHYQRLWFPQPGTGGAIPSRSDYSMTKGAFDQAMPEEFWREVVDRINSEMPNTLLLAEAFWLMEGYFVRTLGMHRVYNSAFMHMLMKEENDKYRDLITNTLEFNPEILKRYVNFMSNPDEETAVNQFGKGDKYFGIALLMVTLPGLPMFAHGQIEGYAEKYGMEYKKAYYNEFPDQHLVWRHEAEILPLIRKRYLFSQVTNFELYDFIDDHGNINENVFAYSNRHGDERALIIYNNSYFECKGTINYSNPKVDTHNGNRIQPAKKLGDALGLKYDQRFFYTYKDHKTKLEHIFSGKEFHDFGMYISLYGYHYRACINFREIHDTNGDYARLNNYLAGRGVPSIEHALKELILLPLHSTFAEIFKPELVEEFRNFCFDLPTDRHGHEVKSPASRIPLKAGKEKTTAEYFNEGIKNDLNNLINELNLIQHTPLEKSKVNKLILDDIRTVKEFSTIWKKERDKKNPPQLIGNINSFLVFFNDNGVKENKEIIFPLILLNKLPYPGEPAFNSITRKNIFEKLMLDKVLANAFERWGHSYENLNKEAELIKVLLTEEIFNLLEKELRNGKTKNNSRFNSKESSKNNFNNTTKEGKIVDILFSSNTILHFINLNEFEGIKYYSKERFDELLNWIFTLNGINILKEELSLPAGKAGLNEDEKGKSKKVKTKSGTTNFINSTKFLTDLKKSYLLFDRIKSASNDAKFKVEELKNLLTKMEPVKETRNKKTSKKGDAKTKTRGKT